MTKKIIQIVQHLRPGGIESLVLNFKHFEAANEEVHIISLEGSLEESCHQWDKLNVYRKHLHFMEKKSGIRIKLIADLWKLLRHLHADVVHTHHIGPLLYGGIAAKLANVSSIIHTEHDAWHLDAKKNQRLESWLLKLIHPTLIADAKNVALNLKNKIPNASPKIIRNGVDINYFKPGSKLTARYIHRLPQDVKLVGCAARLVEVKAINDLIDAMCFLPDNVHLAIAGDGPLLSDLKNQAKSLFSQKRVHFLGNINQMVNFYQALDVFCLPSKMEGMPLSPLEAQACGIPAVVSHIGATSEVVCPDTGILVPPQNTHLLANSLLEILCRQTNKNPRDFVVNTSDIKNMIQQYRELHTLTFTN